MDDEIVGQARKIEATTLGNGLGANYQGVSGVFDAVRIGPYVLKSVWAPGGQLPAIGMEILRRFVITFDASRGVMYLEPTPALREPVPPPS